MIKLTNKGGLFMAFSDLINLLGAVHQSNPTITEDTIVTVSLEVSSGIDYEGELKDIDYDFKTNTITIMCKEVC